MGSGFGRTKGRDSGIAGLRKKTSWKAGFQNPNQVDPQRRFPPKYIETFFLAGYPEYFWISKTAF